MSSSRVLSPTPQASNSAEESVYKNDVIVEGPVLPTATSQFSAQTGATREETEMSAEMPAATSANTTNSPVPTAPTHCLLGQPSGSMVPHPTPAPTPSPMPTHNTASFAVPVAPSATTVPTRARGGGRRTSNTEPSSKRDTDDDYCPPNADAYDEDDDDLSSPESFYSDNSYSDAPKAARRRGRPVGATTAFLAARAGGNKNPMSAAAHVGHVHAHGGSSRDEAGAGPALTIDMSMVGGDAVSDAGEGDEAVGASVRVGVGMGMGMGVGMSVGVTPSGSGVNSLYVRRSAIKLHETCNNRRLSLHRCLASLSLLALPDLLELVDSKGQGEHIFAKKKLARNGQEVMGLHMSGTKNSRRFIHVYLWWMQLLGPNYPISDDMLQGRVWKHLRSTCGFGIVDTRGHRHGDKVCINPHHYAVDSGADILTIVADDVRHFLAEITGLREEWLAASSVRSFAEAATQLSQDPDTTMALLAAYIKEHCPIFPSRPGVLRVPVMSDRELDESGHGESFGRMMSERKRRRHSRTGSSARDAEDETSPDLKASGRGHSVGQDGRVGESPLPVSRSLPPSLPPPHLAMASAAAQSPHHTVVGLTAHPSAVPPWMAPHLLAGPAAPAPPMPGVAMLPGTPLAHMMVAPGPQGDAMRQLHMHQQLMQQQVMMLHHHQQQQQQQQQQLMMAQAQAQAQAHSMPPMPVPMPVPLPMAALPPGAHMLPHGVSLAHHPLAPKPPPQHPITQQQQQQQHTALAYPPASSPLMVPVSSSRHTLAVPAHAAWPAPMPVPCFAPSMQVFPTTAPGHAPSPMSALHLYPPGSATPMMVSTPIPASLSARQPASIPSGQQQQQQQQQHQQQQQQQQQQQWVARATAAPYDHVLPSLYSPAPQTLVMLRPGPGSSQGQAVTMGQFGLAGGAGESGDGPRMYQHLVAQAAPRTG